MRQQPNWSTGIFVAVGTLVALAVAGCGGSSDSAEQRDSAQQPDGTQNYADLEELHAAIIDAGVDCGLSMSPRARHSPPRRARASWAETASCCSCGRTPPIATSTPLPS